MTISGKWRETFAEENCEERAQTTTRDLDIGEIMALSLHCPELDLLAYTPQRLRAHDQPGAGQHGIATTSASAIRGMFGRLQALGLRFPSRNNSGH